MVYRVNAGVQKGNPFGSAGHRNSGGGGEGGCGWGGGGARGGGGGGGYTGVTCISDFVTHISYVNLYTAVSALLFQNFA